MEKIILIGGGGHCKSVIDVIETEKKYEIAGIIDIKEKLGQKLLNYSIIGCDDDIEKLSIEYKNFFITLGFIKNPKIRENLFNKLVLLNLNIPTIKSPFAYVSPHAKISQGSIIMHNCVINAEAYIGHNSIINTGALIEHEAKIGNNTHISTKSVINGQCVVKNNVFFGSNSVLANNTIINDNIIVGAGSVVVKNLTEPGIYVGNPAKLVDL